MKNGSQSNKLRLVDNSGHEFTSGSEIDDMSVQYDSPSVSEPRIQDRSAEVFGNRWLYIATSAVCAAGAIAAGSYAIYLSRRRIADSALEDVQDILKTCQRRMRELEKDLGSTPPQMG